MGFQPTTTDNAWLRIADETLARYNTYDTLYTAKLVGPLQARLHQSGQRDFWRTHFWPMVPVVTAMQRRGVGELDRELRNRARRWVRAAVDDVESAIWSHIGRSSDAAKYTRETFFNSPKQLRQFLYTDLALKSPPATKKRPTESTNQEALIWTLNHLRKKDSHVTSILHDLFHRSKLATILERYLTIEGDSDGRVRPTIKLYGARTGRLAYSGISGEALQQWPDDCRGLIRARPGCVYISRDYSQIEARILAYLSGDRVSIGVFESGGDIHHQNAADLFGTSSVTKAMRNYAKTFLYGISYGGEAESLKLKDFCPCWRCVDLAPPQVNLSRSEVVAAADRWKSRHSCVFTWREALLDSVKGFGKDHTYTSPFGCRRVFMEPREVCKRSLFDYPMQHCAAMVVNRAMRRLHELNAPIVLQMHDSLMLEVPEVEADTWDSRLCEVMEAPVPELGGVVFPTTASRGETWGSLEEVGGGVT